MTSEAWDPDIDDPADYPLQSSVPNDDGDPTSDPATIAARMMVLDAVCDDAIVETAVAKGSVVIVVCPHADWSDDIAKAWMSVVRGEKVLESRRGWRPLGIYFSIPKEDRTVVQKQEDSRDLANAVADGKGALIVTHDIEILAPAERAAADLTIHITAITADQLRKVAAKLYGSGDMPTDIEVAPGMTPTALRLSARPGRTASEFIGRLQSFVVAMNGSKGAREKPAVPGLDGLHGMDEAVTWGRGLARDLSAYDRGELAWSLVDRGCLLSGPPGTGKTMFAKRLAVECGVPLVATSYSEWQSAGKEGHLGELMKCMRRRFAEARQKAPCILFIDELDSVQSRGATSRHDDWWTAIINGLLEQMDGCAEGREGVVIVAASNFADRVDPAIRRAGRLDREVRVQLPDLRSLCLILSEQAKGDLDGVDVSPVAVRLLGGTGADCERAIRGARRRARNAGRALEVGDLMAEVGAKSVDLKSSRRTAIHESAHAVLVAATRPRDIISLSIQERDGRLGGLLTQHMGIGGSTHSDVNAVLRELLAGRAAEEVVLGDVSGGAGGSPDSDLARATLLAVSCEATWGLGGTLTWFGDLSADEVGRFLCSRPDIAQRVERRLAAEYEVTMELVRTRQDAISTMADVLLERVVMTGDEVRAVLASVAELARAPRVVGKRCDSATMART
jgi:hypothetical protein